MDCSTPGFSVHHQLRSLLRLMTIKSVMPSNHLILCCPLLLLPSAFPSIRFFSNESVLRIRWPKYWSFGISLCSEYSGLICFRSDLLALLAVHGALKSLLQLPSSEASILWRSAFFMGQLSHPYMTTGKTIALTNVSASMLSCSVVSDSLGPRGLRDSWLPAHQAPLSRGILQARILEWVAMASSRGSSSPRNRTKVFCIAGGFFTS